MSNATPISDDERPVMLTVVRDRGIICPEVKINYVLTAKAAADVINFFEESYGRRAYWRGYDASGYPVAIKVGGGRISSVIVTEI
jgi:hypothetical protein